MNLTKKGFTLIELLVVVAMIATILGALRTSVSAAQERARKQKALNDVKVVSQAILAYENYARSNKYELPELNDVEISGSSLDFLIGKGDSADSGGQIPAMLMAVLSSGSTLRDPWGTPYRIRIKKGPMININSGMGNLQTGYYLPNFHRLTEEERK